MPNAALTSDSQDEWETAHEKASTLEPAPIRLAAIEELLIPWSHCFLQPPQKLTSKPKPKKRSKAKGKAKAKISDPQNGPAPTRILRESIYCGFCFFDGTARPQ